MFSYLKEKFPLTIHSYYTFLAYFRAYILICEFIFVVANYPLMTAEILICNHINL